MNPKAIVLVVAGIEFILIIIMLIRISDLKAQRAHWREKYFKAEYKIDYKYLNPERRIILSNPPNSNRSYLG